MNATDAGRDDAGMHPMKKAKRAKKTVRKVVRKKVVARRRPTSFSKPDPFFIDPKLVPAGWAYQWTTYVDPHSGWRPVPYSRHAHDFPKAAQGPDGFVVIEGLHLAEIPEHFVRSELASGAQKARDMVGDFDQSIGRDNVGKGWYILSPGFIVEREITREMAHTEGPPVEVLVTLTMKVPQRWSAAAATLDLTLQEYTRRRILMERPLLGCTLPWNGSSEEPFYEPFLLNLAPREA